MISIIIPVYNAQEHIPAMLGCLRAQAASGMAFEAVFVNDGSTDGSPALLKTAQAKESFALRVIDKENGGVSSARNAGLAAARGEYVAFADADDLLAPNYVQVLTVYAQAQPDVLRFGFTRVDAGAASIPAARGILPEKADKNALLKEFLSDPKLFGPYGFLFRREFLQANALRFAEGRAYYEDYDFLVRAVALAEDILSAQSVLYAYRQAAGSAMMRFSAQRVECLELADELCLFLQEHECPAAAEFEKWYKARLYWAAYWQACMALPSPADARRFLRATGGRKLLCRLAGYPSRMVAATAALGAFCPEAYALLAKRLGGRRSFLQEMRRDEADALLRALMPGKSRAAQG